MRQKFRHTGYITFFSLCVFLLGGHAVSAEVREVIYESDFSSDPGWVTDQEENFYWQASTSALFARIDNEPPPYWPNRYHVIETDLDSTQSFELTARIKVLGYRHDGMAIFGLYKDDLRSLNQSGVWPDSNGTANIRITNGSLGITGWSFTMVDKNRNNRGSGGSGPKYLSLDTWYDLTIRYNAASRTAYMGVKDSVTGEVWRQATRTDVVFPKEMNRVGISAHPVGETHTSWYERRGTFDYLIDDVKLEQILPGEPEPEVDPLILEYAPILYFHEEEDYFPMNVEAFVEASSLWDTSGSDDELLFSATDLDFETFESVVENDGEDTENYYLAFSDPENPRSIDLDNAKSRYDALRTVKIATTAVYYHKMVDDFTDDFGENHEYIVLQYWFFYAMNNWGEQGGFNDHEGDWESVFIFLDADTEIPKYIAYSSHLNDDDPSFSLTQYSSVRRDWNSDETVFQNSTLASFVSLGSHANYPNNGNNGDHYARTGTDQTSFSGVRMKIGGETKLKSINSAKSWKWFKGNWGSFSLVPGRSGPSGPLYIEGTGQQRLLEPIEWAGIDKIAGVQLSAPAKILEFFKQKIGFEFEKEVATGTEFEVDYHEEYISYGENIGAIDLLPAYWDITSTLTNGAFQATTTFFYDEELVQSLGEEVALSVYFYDPQQETWLLQPSLLDPENNAVLFNTTHFSRYALGFVELGDLYDLLHANIAELDDFPQRLFLENMARQSQFFAEREHKNAVQFLENIQKGIGTLGQTSNITEAQFVSLKLIVTQIKTLLLNQ